MIRLSKEALLFNDSKCWIKKSSNTFDVTMGSLDGAETAELIGAYLLNRVNCIIPQQYLGLYRDDGLAIVNDANGQKLERIRKELHTISKMKA